MFSDSYTDLFNATCSDLEKIGAYKPVHKLFGPTAKESKAIENGIKSTGFVSTTVDDVIKDRSIWDRVRSSIVGYSDTDNLIKSHVKRRNARVSPDNPRGLKPEGMSGKHISAGLGLAGLVGTGGYHAVKKMESNKDKPTVERIPSRVPSYMLRSRPQRHSQQQRQPQAPRGYYYG